MASRTTQPVLSRARSNGSSRNTDSAARLPGEARHPSCTGASREHSNTPARKRAPVRPAP